jgi:hypothetical protein
MPEMQSVYNAKAPKRLVRLSLNEDLIAQARNVTNNRSELVESLLADFVSKQREPCIRWPRKGSKSSMPRMN